ncbi:MAG TPA: DUF4349 domain-containing protein [Solirubrobacteraceae bacterium]|nr:DUF4349 domain-containing protein [Solirubrobacteraceae bacterium]
MSPINDDAMPQLEALNAIDATLAGEPVAPVHAELAELALLLADERPTIDPDFAAALDRALERRFAAAPTASPSEAGRARAGHRRWWLWTPAVGVAAALIAAIVVVAAGGGAGGGSGHPVMTTASSSSAKVPQALPTASASVPRTASASASAASSASGALSPSSASSGSVSQLGLAPPPNGRKVIQGAQLTLTTAPARVDTVAQEVFDAVGQYRGIVNSSTVTATSGPGGWAQFQLSIPSAALPQAMASLSTLRYARVGTRTDTSQDVNNRYDADVRALADARALRSSLLKQLAGATTQAQIDSLTARIHDAEASISSDEATLRGLNQQINYSQVAVTINGGNVVPVTRQSGGFGLGKAAHDAGRALTVAAGIALIAVAALVPLGLVAALAWWVISVSRRRRREQALDLV